jgi:hypothetical protein
MARGEAYRRLLIDLAQLSPDPQGLGVAVELAGALRLDLLGLFVEDEAVMSLAALPFARELRLPAHAWSALEPERLSADLRETAERIRRVLAAQGARLGVAHRFEVLRGDAAACVAGLCAASDILVLGVPAGIAACSMGSFARSWRLARRAASPVLLLPARIRRRSGPIVVIPARGEDDAAAMAARIALAADADLVLLLTPEAAAGGPRGAAAWGMLPARLKAERLLAASPEAVGAALDRWAERLLVVDRGAWPELDEEDGLLQLARRRQVPILLR